VAAPGAQLRLKPRPRDRVLGLRHGAGGLECHPEHNVLPIADAPLDAATAVAARPKQPRVVHVERVIVLRPFHASALKPAAQLKALGCRQAEHGLRQLRLQLVKHRGAQAAGHPPADTGDNTTAGVSPGAHRVNGGNHALRSAGVGTPHNVGLHLIQSEPIQVNVLVTEVHIAHTAHKCQDLHASHLGQHLLGYGTSSHPADGLTRAGAPAALRVFGWWLLSALPKWVAKQASTRTAMARTPYFMSYVASAWLGR
jgi:hypothetical protein